MSMLHGHGCLLTFECEYVRIRTYMYVRTYMCARRGATKRWNACAKKDVGIAARSLPTSARAWPVVGHSDDDNNKTPWLRVPRPESKRVRKCLSRSVAKRGPIHTCKRSYIRAYIRGRVLRPWMGTYAHNLTYVPVGDHSAYVSRSKVWV